MLINAAEFELLNNQNILKTKLGLNNLHKAN